MIALSQGAGYALTALEYIAAAEGRPVLVREIAADCKLPAAYLAKIVNKLARFGIVRTQRGINGGTSLTRDPSAISVFDVCEAVSDPLLEDRCMRGLKTCAEQGTCELHEFRVATFNKVAEKLRNTTIASLGNGERLSDQTLSRLGIAPQESVAGRLGGVLNRQPEPDA